MAAEAAAAATRPLHCSTFAGQMKRAEATDWEKKRETELSSGQKRGKKRERNILCRKRERERIEREKIRARTVTGRPWSRMKMRMEGENSSPNSGDGVRMACQCALRSDRTIRALACSQAASGAEEAVDDDDNDGNGDRAEQRLEKASEREVLDFRESPSPFHLFQGNFNANSVS